MIKGNFFMAKDCVVCGDKIGAFGSRINCKDGWVCRSCFLKCGFNSTNLSKAMEYDAQELKSILTKLKARGDDSKTCFVCEKKVGMIAHTIKDGRLCISCYNKCGFPLSTPEKKLLEYYGANLVDRLASDRVRMKHVSGLPIAEGKGCCLVFQGDAIIFKEEQSEQTFDLAYNRITGLDIKTDVERSTYFVADTTYTREIFETDYYFNITYQKDSKVEQISFDIFDEAIQSDIDKKERLERLIEKAKPRCSIQKGHTSL